MTKKIIRTVLCTLSICAVFLTAIFSALNYTLDPTVALAVSSGMGLYETSNLKVSANASSNKPPYQRIDLPKEPFLPLGIQYYDSLPPTPEVIIPNHPQKPEETEPSLPAGVFPVIPLNLGEDQSAKGLIYQNESKYSPDLNSILNREYPIKYAKTVSTSSNFEPLVLIIHTHGTECYLPEGADTYTVDTPTRTQNTEQNVVAVGKVLCETLNSLGVPTIQCETMFDAESYSDSYDLSEKTVLEYLAKYPSIQYVFDVHRDSIVRENNEKIKPIITVNEKNAAQAMFVVGTDSGGADHPNWMDNLTVAAYFQQSMIESYGNIMRPINLRNASFNAEHAPGSILIEIGTCGNTVEEAKYCASLLGNSIAPIILNDGL